jgi:hypothetical protein
MVFVLLCIGICASKSTIFVNEIYCNSRCPFSRTFFVTDGGAKWAYSSATPSHLLHASVLFVFRLYSASLRVLTWSKPWKGSSSYLQSLIRQKMLARSKRLPYLILPQKQGRRRKKKKTLTPALAFYCSAVSTEDLILPLFHVCQGGSLRLWIWPLVGSRKIKVEK